MARKGLPKKYAKMGFKKGWAAYKKTKRSRSTPKRSRSRSRSTTKRRSYNMARRKRTYRRRASSMNPMIKGIVGGAASKIGRNFHPLGGAAALIGVGYFMKDSTLKTLGSMELGSALVGMTGIGGGGGSNGYIG